MVALGRALMVGTKLVLLDEPFQGLAPALAKRYGEALLRLREAEPGLAVLISESNPDLLKPMVDSAFLIERGEVRPTTL
jgi:branched-chain amino acid transport system ATP-binding protein